MANGDDTKLVHSAFAFFKQAETALVLVVVGLLLWVGSTTQSTSVSVAQIKVELEYLKSAINKPNPELRELRYKVDQNENLLMDLDGRVEVIEEHVILDENGEFNGNTKKP